MHIALLIITALQFFAPEFIEEGRLFWLRAPLYIVENKTKRNYFYTEEDFRNSKVTGTIHRAKGLGALSEKMAKDALFGENQWLEPIPHDIKGLELLEDLMGEDVMPRRDYIFENVDFSKIVE